MANGRSFGARGVVGYKYDVYVYHAPTSLIWWNDSITLFGIASCNPGRDNEFDYWRLVLQKVT